MLSVDLIKRCARRHLAGDGGVDLRAREAAGLDDASSQPRRWHAGRVVAFVRDADDVGSQPEREQDVRARRDE